ncbi:hypothetical protein PR048_019794 [Dryococelus australis]|uniref:Uncharacterized protein n=1 Tax=Dryococelus australis TaxID=614101 RepID=A0ABQ9H4T7_9NEOP|nr:hypothetical protein PR048_019794 [Dryococelus australis]
MKSANEVTPCLGACQVWREKRGDPRKNPLTSGFVRYNYHVRESESIPAGESNPVSTDYVGNSGRTRRQNGVTSQQHVATSFTNQRLVIYLPPSSADNRETITVRSNQSRTLLYSSKAKSKYRNRIRLEKRASQKQYSDTHKTPYDRVKRCRDKLNTSALSSWPVAGSTTELEAPGAHPGMNDTFTACSLTANASLALFTWRFPLSGYLTPNPHHARSCYFCCLPDFPINMLIELLPFVQRTLRQLEANFASEFDEHDSTIRHYFVVNIIRKSPSPQIAYHLEAAGKRTIIKFPVAIIALLNMATLTSGVPSSPLPFYFEAVEYTPEAQSIFRRREAAPTWSLQDFHQWEIVLDYATGGRVFSGISHFPLPCIRTLFHPRLISSLVRSRDLVVNPFSHS